jgi:hypothetical protein
MFRKTVLVHALSVAFGAAALTAAITSPVMAQSNATGNIFGRVEAPSGASITVLNLDTGLKRSMTPDASGRYQATALPVGRYKVELVRGDKVVDTTEVEVILGQGADASFTSAAVQKVEVSGRRNRIDVSNTNNGATFTAKELARLPITPTVASIIQLAPNTTRGDSRYGDANAPSFGGAAASENAFYINGFPVTNVLLQVGGSELPFGSIGQAQVLSGGYGAEFGRSTGGVMNITTKSGTNNWEVGGSVSIEPNSLRSNAKSRFYPNTGAAENASTDGTVYLDNSKNRRDRKTASVFVGGPLIKDKLFMFANVEGIRTDLENTRQFADNPAAIRTGFQEQEDSTKRALLKLDWNITDNHRLEYTNIIDAPSSDRKYFGFNYATGERGTVQNGGNYYENYGPIPIAAAVGAKLSILKYTGNLTDDLTLTAMIGRSKTEHVSTPVNYNPNIFQVTAPNNARIGTLNYINPQSTTGNLLALGANDKQKVYRFDLEYKLGDHTLRAGLDHNNISSLAGTSRAGGGQWIFNRSKTPTVAPAPGARAPASNGGFGTDGFYVEKRITSGVSTPTVEQAAQYVEDRYQVTKNVLLSLGLRNEQFTNFNGDGQPYVSQRHQLAPRLGVTWDVKGDASLKVFGSAGRYHLQMPTNVAVRAAGSSLFTRQYYTYSGIDQVTGAPTGLQELSGVTSTNNEFGQAKDPRTVAAQGMDALYQDELAFGFEKAFSPSLNFGTKFTYRKLKSTIDDTCDQRPFDAWAVRNGVDSSNYAFPCALFNPGQNNDFLIDFAGDGKLTPVHLTAAEMGFPRVKRTYVAVDFFAEHPLRNGWYGRVNYTWSRNKGNTEGQTRSDSGQADVATTAVFDHPELSLNSDGLLPNHRAHQIKAFGFYEITPQWTVGGNLLLASGRPKNCIGNLPDSFGGADNPASAYDSSFFFCNGVAKPRGSEGTLPWDKRLDLNLAYKPAIVKGLTLKMDIFNITNTQTVQNIEEEYNTAGANTVSALYGGAVSYTAPRTVKLTAEYNYKF